MEYIWKDRKRYLGMPISFTRYAISEDRIFQSIGLLNLRDDETLLYRVRDISVSRSLWQRIFGVGSITITSSDKSTPTLLLKNVKDPIGVKEILHQQVEECKMRRRVRVGEVMGRMDDDDELDDELDGNE